ncbi:hypothetical protein GCM10027599_09610 [Yimella radicis]
MPNISHTANINVKAIVDITRTLVEPCDVSAGVVLDAVADIACVLLGSFGAHGRQPCIAQIRRMDASAIGTLVLFRTVLFLPSVKGVGTAVPSVRN